MISVSFFIIYHTARFFCIAHAVTITLTAYFTYLTSIQLELSLWLSILLAVALTIFIVFSIELAVYRPLRKRGTEPWQLLISSLGVYVIVQNMISLLLGDETRSIRNWEVKVGHEFFGAYITTVQVTTILVSLFLVSSTLLFLHYHPLGKQIRAVASNETLSNIFGISSDRVILWSFGIGSLLAAVAGILIALDTDMTPTMGFNYLLYAVVAMIIGGAGNYWGLFAGAFLLTILQHFAAYQLDSKWMNAFAFIVLVAFLAWKPYGFTGRKLRKVEI